MKVSVSIFGRFHFFDLARQLNQKNLLHQLITTYPKFKAKEWGIASKQTISLIILELLRRVISKTKFFNIINPVLKQIYGYLSFKLMDKDIDVFIFFAGNGFNYTLMKKLQSRGVICIVDEGSAHILSQRRLLEEEYKQLGLEYKNKQSKRLLDETLLEYNSSDYIVVPSLFVKSTFIEQGINNDKILVNPYGVDLSQFKQIEKKDDVFRVIYCGRLSIQKGSHYLLQAIYELEIDDFELWHIGGVEDEMTPFIKKYKANNILYKGTHPQAELYKFYSQGSAFILPSIQDGFGMVIFQAMACGLPVVLSENTGAYDVVTKDGEEGFVIPIRSVEAIKEKIKYLYENQDICIEMGRKAKRRVSYGFTWDDYGKRYIDFLKKIQKNII
jgi:glycosyltransferase involved in cell wall biosynthesis